MPNYELSSEEKKEVVMADLNIGRLDAIRCIDGILTKRGIDSNLIRKALLVGFDYSCYEMGTKQPYFNLEEYYNDIYQEIITRFKLDVAYDLLEGGCKNV